MNYADAAPDLTTPMSAAHLYWCVWGVTSHNQRSNSFSADQLNFRAPHLQLSIFPYDGPKSSNDTISNTFDSLSDVQSSVMNTAFGYSNKACFYSVFSARHNMSEDHAAWTGRRASSVVRNKPSQSTGVTSVLIGP
jgi:hypothetical protein